MSARTGAAPGTIRLLRFLGYLVYITAFFLPAVRQVAAPGAGAPDTYKGWFCAWVTIINTLNHEMWQSKDFLAILSGWINPLLFLYVASLFSRKLRLFRRIVAVVIVLFIVGTWVYFYLVPLIPVIGHVLWIVGILLVLAGEVLKMRENPIP